MDALLVLAAVAEAISWIGLGLGLPLLVLGLALRAADGRWRPAEIVILHGGATPLARWYLDGDFHQRSLTAREAAILGSVETAAGYLKEGDSASMRLAQRSAAVHAIWVAGLTLCSVGAGGFILSFLPVLLG